MTWANALVRGLGIFLYFAVATVWIPNLVLKLLADSSNLIQDLSVTLVWAVALGFGMWALRYAQRRGLI